MKNDDELLDEIAVYLRNESVPEMPRHAASSRAASKSRRWVWGAAAAGVMAASSVVFLIWSSEVAPAPGHRQVDGPPVIVEDHDNSSVVVRPVDLAAPLVQIEAQLDLMDAEIAELRVKAGLLDARRKADELLVRH